MTDIEHRRHSLAHLLGAAILDLYPKAKLAIGPAIDNGFYYDIEFPGAIGEDQLKTIQSKMIELLPTFSGFQGREVTSDEARDFFKDNPYKLEIINELAERGEKITLYTSGTFTDLCRGGHENNLSIIDPASFILERLAGAYWRGDEKNKMLTRVYGLAFDSATELSVYQNQIEEARKRDHKKIGKEMGLFVFSDLVGPGLPLWTPKGTIIRELLNDYVWALRQSRGYQKVTIPHITKKDLYEVSGHWQKYAADLFKINTREDHLYAMKPMNCPHHTQIFAAFPRSYRQMPQRYAETTMVYRDEQSGELSGLSRVLSITQDDAHVFCRRNQVEEEMLAVWDIIDTFYGSFGFKDMQVRFSRHDPEQFDKYLGSREIWAEAEETMTSLLKQRNIEPIDGKGEAAFYGPKLDFIARDSIGRVLQVATIQLDFNQPKNFNLEFTNEKGEKEMPVMIHAAIMGSLERFISTLIEHTAGLFPFWLCPVQVTVLPVSAENHGQAAAELAKKLSSAVSGAGASTGVVSSTGLRVELSDENQSLGKRIRAAKTDRVPYLIVVGDKEMTENKFTLEGRNDEKIEGLSAEEILTLLQKKVESKE